MGRYWPTILLLAAMWGASYLFIKLAVDDIPPAAMTELRVLIAGVLLAIYLAVRMGTRRAVLELRAAWLPCLVLGVINAALPMGLVAWGETHIDSSVAGVAQSTVPIFTFLLAARFLPHEPVGPMRVAGVALGFFGVAVLAGFHTEGGAWAVAGTLAVVLSSLSYASGGVYGQLQVKGTPGPVLAAGNMLAAAIILLAARDCRPADPGARGRRPWQGSSGSSSSRPSRASCSSSACCACSEAGSSRSSRTSCPRSRSCTEPCCSRSP